MKVLVSGTSGLIGAALKEYLLSKGHTVICLVRARTGAQEEVLIDLSRGCIESDKLEGIDAAINLAGENVAQRWTAEARRRIADSRIKGTSLLASTLAGLEHKPDVLISASAIGFYGDRGDEILTEASRQGQGFLSQVCAAWEEALSPARDAGIRTASLRLGLVLSRSGGALGRMLLPFQLGIGGNLGSGKQYMSWISIDDVVRSIELILECRQLSGPVNLVSPTPVTNAEFTAVLSRVLHRKAVLHVPQAILKLAFGSAMAQEMLLASSRVMPAKLQAAAYDFQCPTLESALLRLLSKESSVCRTAPAR